MHAVELGGRGVACFDLFVLVGAGLCVTAVLAAVAINFFVGLQAGGVERRVTSPVATSSMMGFFVVILGVLRLQIGVLVLAPGPRQAVMLTGLVLMVAGALVNVLGRLQLGRNWADQVTLYSEQTLVQTGVYAYVRHPLYASLIWLFVGGGLVFRNLVALAATVVVFLPAMVIRARQEEKLLEERFPEYDAYRRRVGMLFPRPVWGDRRS